MPATVPRLAVSETAADGGAVPALDLLVRVGCRLAFDTEYTVPIVLGVRPQSRPGLAVVERESLTIDGGLPVEGFIDGHGNAVERVVLPPGRTVVTHDALVAVSSTPDNLFLPQTDAVPVAELPLELLRYVLPSRYADSDKLLNFAWQQFGAVPNGRPRVQAICDWLHDHLEYRFGSGRPDLSAWDVIQRGYGVCRDFAHAGVALCRTFNLPARYVTGHLPDIGYVDPGSPMDFHAYFEVYLDGAWLTFDARYNVPRIGRIRIASGLDAVDAPFATIYGAVNLGLFEVWAYQVAPGTVEIGDPIDLTKRLDGAVEVRRI
ncbi:MAG TPA: transglutaminase family protein [Opitutaceae bacterium]|nr:transglutaminase family protein [Opitutaceae bacterium]